MADLDEQIDRLYQADLGAFIPERNALAKASRRADVKTLPKPSVPAWAVNQIYWHQRPLFDRLVARAEAVRDQHRRTLASRSADVRGAETAHRETLREAVDAARRILTEAGHPVTPATVEAVSRTLEALPSPEATGRLVKPLTPAGLEALAGLSFGPPRSGLRVLQGGLAPDSPPAPADADRAARAEAERDAQVRAEQEAREQAERERRRAAAAARDAAQAAFDRAAAAVTDAERALAARQQERDRAANALAQAVRAMSD